MDKFKKVVEDMINNKECKIIETVATGKFVKDK